MTSIDSNLLVHAHRVDTPEYEIANELVADLATGDVPFAVAWPSVYEFARVVTHPQIYEKPTSTRTLLTQLDSLLSSPAIRVLGPGPRHWAIAQSLLTPIQPIARAAFDVQIAAILLEAGVSTIYTRDPIFETFGLRVFNPFSSQK